MLVDKQTYFDNFHHQKNFYQGKNLNQMLVIFLSESKLLRNFIFFNIFDFCIETSIINI